MCWAIGGWLCWDDAELTGVIVGVTGVCRVSVGVACGLVVAAGVDALVVRDVPCVALTVGFSGTFSSDVLSLLGFEDDIERLLFFLPL